MLENSNFEIAKLQKLICEKKNANIIIINYYLLLIVIPILI